MDNARVSQLLGAGLWFIRGTLIMALFELPLRIGRLLVDALISKMAEAMKPLTVGECFR